MDTLALFRNRYEGSLAALLALQGQLPALAEMAEAIVARLKAGGTLYTAGNGGSAAQALHLAEELIGRYRGNRPPYRAVCLNADPTALTCIANDFGYEQVFARQCEALLTDRDVLAVFTTSGNSPNIVRALDVAKQRKSLAVGLLGRGGGACLPLCRHAITIDRDASGSAISDSAHIQEAHEVAMHLICEALEAGIS